MRNWRRLRDNAIAVGIGVLLAAVPLGVLEVVLRGLSYWDLNQWDSIRAIRYEGNYSDRFFEPNALLGYWPPANSVIESTKYQAGHLIYRTTYSIDGAHRRDSHPPIGSHPEQHALFFGCSFVFGEGVQDDETLPVQFEKLAPRFHAYNYGVPGWGPQQMLALLQEGAIVRDVPERNGRAYFVFIDGHVSRAIGSLAIHAWWGSRFPYYVIEDGKLIRKGDFTSGRPVRSWIYSLLGRSAIVWYVPLDWPRPIRSSHIALTARILEEAKKAYSGRFGSDAFSVVIYPGSRYGGRLAHELRAAHVEVLDYTDLFDPRDPSYRFDDRHPSALAHHRLAEALVGERRIAGSEPTTLERDRHPLFQHD